MSHSQDNKCQTVSWAVGDAPLELGPCIAAIGNFDGVHRGHGKVIEAAIDAARKAGVVVDVFSVGFGPEIYGWTSKTGTRWRIASIPLGGYIKMRGDEDAVGSTLAANHQQIGSFANAGLYQRMSIVAAGPGKVSDSGKTVAMEVKKGDRILYGKYSGTEFSFEGTDYLIMRESDILAVL